jgi:hypothetical protein
MKGMFKSKSTIQFFVCLLIGIAHATDYPIWECPRIEYPRNESTAHNAIATERLQKWITSMQYTCSKSKKVITTRLKENGGMGHHLSQTASRIWMALELNEVYRPLTDYKWAEAQQNCTFSHRYVDCFTEPISPCFQRGVETPMGKNALASESVGYSLAEALRGFSTKPLDTCNVARLSEKSLQWVSGQMFLYLLRLRKDIQAEVDLLVGGTSQNNTIRVTRAL